MSTTTRRGDDGPDGGIGDFAAFYEEHAEGLVIYFARRCLDPLVAVELMAETFANAFAKRRSYRGASDGEASGWLFAIARRQLADYFRRGRAEQKAVRRLGLMTPALADEDYERIEELADLVPIRRALRDEFEALSVKEREAVRLRVIEEMPYADVAGHLRISEDNARARVSRGLRRLRSLRDEPALARGGRH